MKLTIEEIITAVGGSGAPGFDAVRPVSGISTDTRTLRAGEAFFALSGENHDAHDHLAEAAGKGASLLVISDVSKAPECGAGAAGVSGAAGEADGVGGAAPCVLLVEDTLRAYQDLAAYYRRRLDPFVIAVTGSVGKTTLKDMIACILSGHRRVCSTKGNLNNQIGVPRTILEADEGTEALVLEMGMERAGEIERLAEIARPDICVISNIGISHRGNFTSDEGIVRAKYEISSYLGAGGSFVINASGSEALLRYAEEGSAEKGFALVRVAEQGTAAELAADYVVTAARVSGGDAREMHFEIEERKTGAAVPFAVPMAGTYAGVSAALASAVCARAGISLAESAEALKGLNRTPHRLEPVSAGGVLVIDDTYNASPDSVKSGLDYLINVPAKRRIAVLADMNDLGPDSEALHFETGAAAAGAGVDSIFTFGEKARGIADGALAGKSPGISDGKLQADERRIPVCCFGPGEKAELLERLIDEVREGDAVYIKGSHSMKMEEVAKALKEARG